MLLPDYFSLRLTPFEKRSLLKVLIPRSRLKNEEFPLGAGYFPVC